MPTPATPVALGLGLLMVLAMSPLAACGGGGTDDGDADAGRPADEPPPSPSTEGTAADDAPLSRVPPPTTPPPSPPVTPSDQVAPRTVQGTLAEVAGCLVVDTATGRWALEGDVPAGLAAGTSVEVTARPAPQAESPCGSPVLRVITITVR